MKKKLNTINNDFDYLVENIYRLIKCPNTYYKYIILIDDVYFLAQNFIFKI